MSPNEQGDRLHRATNPDAPTLEDRARFEQIQALVHEIERLAPSESERMPFRVILGFLIVVGIVGLMIVDPGSLVDTLGTIALLGGPAALVAGLELRYRRRKERKRLVCERDLEELLQINQAALSRSRDSPDAGQ